MASSKENIVYVGTFIHCISLKKLSTLESQAIGVNEKGIIQFIERADERLADKVKSYGWESWKTVRAPEGRVGFWFPGFIGMYTFSAFKASQGPNVYQSASVTKD